MTEFQRSGPEGHERVYLGGANPANEALHLERYQLAASRLDRNHEVLDAASGSGYGTQLLARNARRVVGVDNSLEALAYAQLHHHENNISYVAANLDAVLPFKEAQFDTVVSFETLEHVTNQSQLLCEFARVLRQGGTLILSTPDRLMYSDTSRYRNPFHVHEYSKGELLSELADSFDVKEVYGQVRYSGSRTGEAVFWITRIDVLKLRRLALRLTGAARRLQERVRRFRIHIDKPNVELVAPEAPSAHLFLIVVAVSKGQCPALTQSC